MKQQANNPYLMNTWYIAALPSEVDATELFARTLLDIPVLFYRKQDGTPVAVHDRCPHRFAPLHRGWREGDRRRSRLSISCVALRLFWAVHT